MAGAFGSQIQSSDTKLSDFRKKPSIAAVKPGEQIVMLKVKQITCLKQIRGEDNPGFSEASLEELGSSMEAEGQVEPCIVRPIPNTREEYYMVAGERRLRAADRKGLDLACVIRNLTDAQARRIQRAENIHQAGLTLLDEARSLREDMQDPELDTPEKLAAHCKKSLNWVYERLRFLDTMEAGGQASVAVTEGVTADISTVLEIRRLEKASPQAAAEFIEEAKADPNMNLRKAVREKRKEVAKQVKATPSQEPVAETAPATTSPDGANENSRMRESMDPVVTSPTAQASSSTDATDANSRMRESVDPVVTSLTAPASTSSDATDTNSRMREFASHAHCESLNAAAQQLQAMAEQLEKLSLWLQGQAPSEKTLAGLRVAQAGLRNAVDGIALPAPIAE